jgi:acetyltransferase-like isoleucine patch superfamily enzyme
VLSGRYQHNFTDPSRGVLSGSDQFSLVRIGAGSFVGENSVIMADIGPQTIVGAGSVVVKPLPGYVVAVGNPARIIKRRDPVHTEPEQCGIS